MNSEDLIINYVNDPSNLIADPLQTLLQRQMSLLPFISPPIRPTDYLTKLVDDSKFRTPRPLPNYSLADQEDLRKIIYGCLTAGTLEPAEQTELYSVPSLVPKPDGSRRMVIIFVPSIYLLICFQLIFNPFVNLFPI